MYSFCFASLDFIVLVFLSDFDYYSASCKVVRGFEAICRDEQDMWMCVCVLSKTSKANKYNFMQMNVEIENCLFLIFISIFNFIVVCEAQKHKSAQ